MFLLWHDLYPQEKVNSMLLLPYPTDAYLNSLIESFQIHLLEYSLSAGHLMISFHEKDLEDHIPVDDVIQYRQ